jgi:hypothetical protein
MRDIGDLWWAFKHIAQMFTIALAKSPSVPFRAWHMLEEMPESQCATAHDFDPDMASVNRIAAVPTTSMSCVARRGCASRQSLA